MSIEGSRGFSEEIELAQSLRRTMPINTVDYVVPERSGTFLVDLVNGFCKVGAGYLAPPVRSRAVDRMVALSDVLVRRMLDRARPTFTVCDTHDAPEPPYPPHCMRGSGEELLVPRLDWFNCTDGVTVREKDVINAYVGLTRPDGGNDIVDWINQYEIEALIVTGICTDICDLQFVQSMLSARNHRVNGKPLMPTLKDIVVYAPACATYDLPLETAQGIGLPSHAAHPGLAMQHVGLNLMAHSGAIIATSLDIIPDAERIARRAERSPVEVALDTSL